MGFLDSDIGQTLGDLANKIGYLYGVNSINGSYNVFGPMHSFDDKGNEIKLGKPELEFDSLSSNSDKAHLYFKTEKDQVVMNYTFRVTTQAEDATPLIMTDLDLKMHIPDNEGTEKIVTLTHVMLNTRPQTAVGAIKWKNHEEFFSLKDAIIKGEVYITWTGNVQWLDKDDPEIKELLKNAEHKPQPKVEKLEGTIPVVAIPDKSNSYSMFDGVKNLLCWDYEILDERKVYFKDPLKDDFIYFLPQEYRVRALPTNAPDMSTEITPNSDGGFKALMRFRIAPYVHPNAKRDAYRIFLSRKNKKYCELRYGGYESARFEWGGEMKDGSLYGSNGFTSINPEGTVESAPESSFFIVLESPTDGIVELFQDKIMNEGIVIGNVYFTVKEGISEKEIELDPIPVKLDLHSLSGLKPDVRVLECKWPNYNVKITNEGQYPIVIGDVALSVLHRDKNEVKDAAHNLKCSNQWPVTLNPSENVTVELTPDQVEKLKKKNFWGKPKEDYWNELICEPYHIRLQDETLKMVLTKTNDSAYFKHETWTLTAMTSFHWSEVPDLTAVQVELKNQFGLNESILLTAGEEKLKVNMVPNLSAEMSTRNAGDRVFEYRLKVITRNGPKEGEWRTESGDTLFIYKDDIDIIIKT